MIIAYVLNKKRKDLKNAYIYCMMIMKHMLLIMEMRCM